VATWNPGDVLVSADLLKVGWLPASVEGRVLRPIDAEVDEPALAELLKPQGHRNPTRFACSADKQKHVPLTSIGYAFEMVFQLGS
jgi:hypothetical protein